jgi:hypothetical protein
MPPARRRTGRLSGSAGSAFYNADSKDVLSRSASRLGDSTGGSYRLALLFMFFVRFLDCCKLFTSLSYEFGNKYDK